MLDLRESGNLSVLKNKQAFQLFTFLKNSSEIDLCTFQSLPLRFVDGHGPCQNQRELWGEVSCSELSKCDKGLRNLLESY